MPRKLGIRPWFLRDRGKFRTPLGAVSFGHTCVVRRLVSVRRSRHGGDHPGGNLAISATRTLTVLNGFREMVGTTLPGVPTPCTKLAAAPVEGTTGVFAAT